MSETDLPAEGAPTPFPGPAEPAWTQGRRNRRDLLWADYVALIHPDDTRGVVSLTYSARVVRDGQDAFRTKVAGATGPELREAVQRHRPRSFTMSAFRPGKDGSHVTRPCKATWNLSSLGALWVDLDFYRLAEYRYATPETMVQTVLNRCYDRNLQEPSFLLRSGRGLLAVWLHDRQRPALLPVWTHMQRRLNETFADMGRDVVAMPCTASFRVAGTQNGGDPVEVLWPEWADEVTRYDFHSLRADLLPYTPAQVAEYRKAKQRKAAAKAAAKAQGEVQARPRLTRETYSRAVLQDLTRLFHDRHRGLPVPVGQRDLWLYSLTVAAAWTMTPDALEAEVDRLAPLCGMSLRLARGQMRAVVRKAKQAVRGEHATHRRRSTDARYRSNPKTLLAALGITTDEVERLDLRVLVPRAMRQAREAERSQQRRRQAGAKDRSAVQEKRLALGMHALDEKAAGRKVTEIAFEANVSVSHVEKAMREARAVQAIGRKVEKPKVGRPRKAPPPVQAVEAPAVPVVEQLKENLAKAERRPRKNPFGSTGSIDAYTGRTPPAAPVGPCVPAGYNGAVHGPAPQDYGHGARLALGSAGASMSGPSMPAFLLQMMGLPVPDDA